MPERSLQPNRLADVLFERVRLRVRRLRLAWGCVLALGVSAAGILFLDGLNRLHPWREVWAFWGVTLVLGLGLIVLVRHGLTALLRGPSVRDLALEVERVRPEFMDSLICAVELEARPEESLNALEGALLRDVRDKFRNGADVTEVFQERLRLRPILLAGMGVAVCLVLALHSPVWAKAWFYAGDLRRGAGSGLTIHGPDESVPVHSDARLEVLVHRWEREAEIEYADAEGRHRYRMNSADADQFFFTFYDLTSPVRYRILTPSLASPWQRIDIYSPPWFEDVKMSITPPEYTGLEPTSTTEFCDVSALVGSRFRIAIRTQPGVRAYLRTRESTREFEIGADGAGDIRFVVTQDETFSVRLVDSAGHETLGPAVVLTSRPDLPPVVDIVRPRKDMQVGVEEKVSLEARAGDDFGLREVVLLYSISGAPRRSVTLASPTERVLDQVVHHGFDIREMGLKAGDVISYVVEAKDNREPEPQTARSEVYFIVVRPKVDAKEQDGQQGKQMKIDLGAVIAESKRLIRFSWDALSLAAEEQSAAVKELGRGLRDLRIEVRKIFNRIESVSGGLIAPPIPELFKTVDRELNEALALTDKDLAEESLAPQERALTALVRLENELLKNAMKGKGKGESEKKTSREKKEKERAKRQSGADALRALKNALRKARDLAARQDRLNRAMERTPAVSPEAARGLEQKQNNIRGDTEDLAKSLGELAPARGAAGQMTGAAGEMKRGEQRLKRNDVETAGRHGKRAANLLNAALSDLQDAVRNAAAKRIEGLAAAAGELADEQRQAAEVSRDLEAKKQVDEATRKAAETEQRTINERAENLRRALENTSDELGEQFPEAIEALNQAARTFDRQGGKRNMARAANALLYGKFGRARPAQTNAANDLRRFSRELAKAVGKLPAMSREELLEAMQRMRQRAGETTEAMQQDGKDAMGRLQNIRDKAADDLDRLARTLSDRSLRELADGMQLPMGEGNPSEAGANMLRMFQAAVAVLERHLLVGEVRRKLTLSRRQSVPPEKYRRLVEQYFRELSRDQ